MNIAHMTQRLAGVHLASCSGNPCDCGAAETQIATEPADRRGPVKPYKPERRGGFDRRGRVAPAKKGTK